MICVRRIDYYLIKVLISHNVNEVGIHKYINVGFMCELFKPVNVHAQILYGLVDNQCLYIIPSHCNYNRNTSLYIQVAATLTQI